MSELVEKVRAAISETSSSFYSLPADNPEWMLHHAQARAAIAAVLEHLANNVSDEMVEAALTAKRGLQVNHHATDQRVYLAKQISAALRAAAGSALEAKP